MTRDEAIGRIKARFDKWALDDEDMKAIQTLIPELSESEDERIRKAIVGLIEELQRSDKNFAGVELTDMLDYLEKQEEQKPTPDWMPKFLDKLRSMKNYFDWDEHREIEGYILAIINWIAPNYFDRKEKEQKPISQEDFDEAKHEALWGEQKPAEWSEDTIRKAVKEVGLTQHQINWFKNNVFPPKPEWSEEDEKKLERVDDLLWMLDDYLGNDCSICEEKTARLRDEIHNELFPWLEFLRPQYHGDVTMTEAYKMGLEAGKASSWKPSEKQTNNVIVELTRIELGDIINGLYYLKEKYYEDCKEHNGTATVGLSDEFKFYFKRFNEALDLYTRLHELEKEKYGTTTDGYYYE